MVSLADYGAFIDLGDGVEGLIPVSEMSWVKRIKHPSQVLNEGDEVEVRFWTLTRKTAESVSG